MHKLDHIVIGAMTLEDGTRFVENKLQAKLSDIGYHKDLGTHNRVIRISDDVYLEVIAIDPENRNLKNRQCFNLDNSNLQSKLEKSPQIISYVIESKFKNIFKYYDPFFEVSRSKYRWLFAMPTYKNNMLDRYIIETGVIPSLIFWKSEKPINFMERNQFELISFEIEIYEKQQSLNSFFNSFGEIKYVGVSVKDEAKYPTFKLKLKDNFRDTIISL